MVSRIRSYCLLIFLCSALVADGQVIKDIRRYSTADGLSDNRVSDIKKDSEGFMWFGSWAGISRFDGHNFQIYKSYPGDRSSLKNNRIDELAEDPENGVLWLRAYDSQIYQFDKRTQRFTALADLLNNPGVGKLHFTKILVVKDGTVWLKVGENSLFYVSPGKKPHYKLYPSRLLSGELAAERSIVFFQLDWHRNVWVGTDAGLALLQKQNDLSYKVRKLPLAAGFLPLAMTENKAGVWVSGRDGKVVFAGRYLKEVKQFKVSDADINELHVSKIQDKIYAVTGAGELLSLTLSGRVERHLKYSASLKSFYEDKQGVLWINAADKKLIRLDLAKDQMRTFSMPANYHPYIFEDVYRNVWMFVRGSGLFYYNNESEALEKFNIKTESEENDLSKSIIRVYYDSVGVFWMGIENEGVEKLVLRNRKFKTYSPSSVTEKVEDNYVRSVFFDSQSRLWTATKSGGLSFYKDNRQYHPRFNNRPSNEAGIYSILENKNGSFWFATKANGLIRAVSTSENTFSTTQYTSRSSRSGLSSNSIYCLLQDKKGRIWAGSFGEGLILIQESQGKVQFKTVKNSFRNYPAFNNGRIRHMAEDAEGNIWIGTTEGLLIFNPDAASPDNLIFKRYRKEAGNMKSLGGNDVQYIYQDSQQRMWVLTSSGGLNLAQGADPLKSLSFVNYSMRNGLPSDFLLSCVEDDQQNLWIATQNGVSKFSLKTRKFQNFTHHDGLNKSAFSEGACTKMANGDLIFGTTTGFLRFNPGRVKTRKIAANIAFTNLQINSQDVEPGEGSPLNAAINHVGQVNLRHDQNIISIDFALLDFYSSGKQNYACRLMGFDDVWRSTEGQRRATYTKLPPGDYTFQVKSLNEDLYTHLPFKSLKITVLPPPWKTWWAYTLYLIAALLILALIWRVAMTMLRLKHRIAVERGLADLKLSFFTQISHELRTPLTLIINPSEEVLHHENLSGKGKEYMNVVVKNARRMVRLVNQVLDLRKVQSGKASLNVREVQLLPFIYDVAGYFQETIKTKGLRFSVLANDEGVSTWIDIEKMEIVLYNLLANSVKFSDEGGQIRVVISDNGTEYVCVQVCDDGPGVKEAEYEDIFKLYYEGQSGADKHLKGTGIGLALAKELVELHAGKIYAKANSPRGLNVVVELKKGKQHFNSQITRFLDGDYIPDARPVEADPPALDPATCEDTNRLKVLLVEDNDDLRAFLGTRFSGMYCVETASNGEEGFQKAISIMPDLILSDIMMPKMDGIQMLDALKSDRATSHIPVILLSARSSVESQIEGLRYGADYYISKPFQMEFLQVAIESIISRRKSLFESLVEELPVADTEAALIANITRQDQEFLQKIIDVVENKLEDSEFNIDEVAETIGMSRSAFFKKFKSLTNMAPVEFVRETRLKKARALFDSGEDNVSTAAYAVGFNNPKYFSTCFKAYFNQTPREYLSSLKELIKHPVKPEG